MSIHKSIGALLSMLLAMASPFAAADTEGALESGGYLEIGTAVYAERTIKARLDGDDRQPTNTGAGVYVAGAWRKGTVFFEGRRGGVDGASLGITLWHDERRALELLAAHLPGSVKLGFRVGEDEVGADEDDRARSAALLDRDQVVGTSGLRYREYRGDTLLQASAVADWQHGNGLVLGLHVGHQWQLGNWNLQGIVGLRGVGAELVDYLYGVDEDEATTRFAAYRGEDTLFGETELTVTRALGRDWVLRSNLIARHFGDGISDSPLVAADDALSAELGVAYVF